MGMLRTYRLDILREKLLQKKPKLVITRIQNMVILLPHLQKKCIVAKLEELLSLCEKLK